MEIETSTETYRSYIFFWIGQILSLLGSLVIQFTFTWYIEDTTGDPILLSVAQFCFILPMVIFSPIGGVIADKYDKKKVIILVDSMQAFATFILIIFFSTGLGSIPIIFLFITIRAVFQAFHQPTFNSVAPSMVPKANLSRINGLNFLFTGLMSLIGPMIGGILYGLIPFQQIFWIDIITLLISFIPLLKVKIPSVHKERSLEKISSFIGDLSEGFSYLKAIPGLLIMVLVSMIVNFLIQPVGVLLPNYVHTFHGGQEFEYILISASLNVGMIIGSVITAVKKQWKSKVFISFAGITFIGIGYLGLGLIPIGGFLFIALDFLLIAIVLPIINTIYQTILQISVPQDKFGRVSSIDSTLSTIIMPVGTIISGPLAVAFGLTNLFIFFGFLTIVTTLGIYFLTNIRHIRYDDDLIEENEDKSFDDQQNIVLE